MYEVNPIICKPNFTGRYHQNLNKQRVKQIVSSKLILDSGKYRLGLAWIALKPILTASLYMFIFEIVRANTNGWSILLGIGLLTTYSTSIMRGLLIHSNSDSGIKIERIYSRIIIISNILFSCIQNIIQTLPIAFVILFWTDSLELFFSFLIISQLLGIWSLGIGFFLSSFIKQTPDLIPLFGFINLALFFLSPVLYSLSDAPDLVIKYSFFNPLTYFLELCRYSYIQNWSIFYEASSVALSIFLLSILLSFWGFFKFDHIRWKVSSWS